MTTLLWKPLLASSLPMDPDTGDFRWDLIVFPVWASPKFDGYRAMVQRGVLTSRGGLAVANRELQRRYGRKDLEGLDGELCTGRPTATDVYHATSRVVRKAEADASTTNLYVIDTFTGLLDFKERHLQLMRRVETDPTRWGVNIIPIKQQLIKTLDKLKTFERECLRQGYEGVMLRRGDQGAYPQKGGKENRSTLKEFDLVRLKRFEYEEATILAVHPLMHNTNEERTATGKRATKKAGMVEDKTRVGSATLKDRKIGVEFDTTIGAEALRSWAGWKRPELWRGKTVRYKFQAVGTVDRPRINTCDFAGLTEG
jgi:DNA ligase-1